MSGTHWGRARTGSPTPFRIVTLNLLHDPRSPTWPERAPLVEAELGSLAPDIVLLQEVAWPDQQATRLAAALRDETGREYAVQLTALLPPNGWQEGLAILSRFPTLDFAELQLPDSGKFCQRARFDLGGKALDVYNVHLDPFSPERVREQVRATLAWMGAHADTAGAILGGDFNATPDRDAIAQVRECLRSAYAVVHGGEPEYTAPTPFGVERQRREGRPSVFETLDYLWLSPALTVIDARLAFARPAHGDSSLYPSDHFGLRGDLRWAP
jgi:endonuclease/exonuclease/phosphatase family metal-dependent hydrolase